VAKYSHISLWEDWGPTPSPFEPWKGREGKEGLNDKEKRREEKWARKMKKKEKRRWWEQRNKKATKERKARRRNASFEGHQVPNGWVQIYV
jgi:hypothetical protein